MHTARENNWRWNIFAESAFVGFENLMSWLHAAFTFLDTSKAPKTDTHTERVAKTKKKTVNNFCVFEWAHLIKFTHEHISFGCFFFFSSYFGCRTWSEWTNYQQSYAILCVRVYRIHYQCEYKFHRQSAIFSIRPFCVSLSAAAALLDLLVCRNTHNQTFKGKWKHTNFFLLERRGEGEVYMTSHATRSGGKNQRMANEFKCYYRFI